MHTDTSVTHTHTHTWTHTHTTSTHWHTLWCAHTHTITQHTHPTPHYTNTYTACTSGKFENSPVFSHTAFILVCVEQSRESRVSPAVRWCNSIAVGKTALNFHHCYFWKSSVKHTQSISAKLCMSTPKTREATCALQQDSQGRQFLPGVLQVNKYLTPKTLYKFFWC